MTSDAAPPYEALRRTVHLEHDGTIHLDIPPELTDIWQTLPGIDEKTTPSTVPRPDTSSSHGQDGAHIPRMNILMLVIGSRGDVQPFIVLAVALIKYGHRVRLATHGTFRHFIESMGVEFFDLGGSPVELMAYMVDNPGLIPKFAAWRKGDVMRNRRSMGAMINASWRACFEATRPNSTSTISSSRSKGGESKRSAPKKTDPVPFVADAIIANPPSTAHIHCAEKLGLPLHIMFTMPWSPTAQMPHPLATITTPNVARSHVNFMSYMLVESLIWQGLGSIINNFRYKVLQLDPIHPSRGPSLLQTARIPHTYAWSPSLLPKPADWSSDIAVTGYLNLENRRQYSPPENLQRFLETGPAPMYVGFGSIVLTNAAATLDLVISAVHLSGNRVILAKGWSGGESMSISQASYSLSDTLILHEDCPHDWLFPQVSCVIHHGGAGTTAAGLQAGKPTIVVPFFGDQFFWGDRVAQFGAGPAPIPHGKLTLDNLHEAIRFAVREDTIIRAAELGFSMRAEDGTNAAIESFHSHLPKLGLSCRLLPNRAAMWKSKELGVPLSAAAAAVLQKSLFLDFKQLELHRKLDLDIAHGPYEPASGAAWAITELFLDSFRGMGEILAEVGYMPVSTYRMFARLKSKKDKSSPEDLPPGYTESSSSVQSPNMAEKRQKVPGEYMFTGTARVCKAAARAPGEFTAAMANGAHDLPRLWGDQTMRPAPKVTGFKSGMSGGAKELFWGVTDGCTGLFVQPVKGAIKDGPIGFVKGTASGILGFPVKFFAAACGVAGYPLKGIDLALSRALRDDDMSAVTLQAKLQGEYEASRLSESDKADVVRLWREIVVHHDRKGKDSKKR